jgi:hypothetical protein
MLIPRTSIPDTESRADFHMTRVLDVEADLASAKRRLQTVETQLQAKSSEKLEIQDKLQECAEDYITRTSELQSRLTKATETSRLTQARVTEMVSRFGVTSTPQPAPGKTTHGCIALPADVSGRNPSFAGAGAPLQQVNPSADSRTTRVLAVEAELASTQSRLQVAETQLPANQVKSLNFRSNCRRLLKTLALVS